MQLWQNLALVTQVEQGLVQIPTFPLLLASWLGIR